MALTPTVVDSWLRRFHPAPGAAVRLFCLPHAGGSASYWFPLSAALSPRLDVVSVQYPGRQDRRTEPCVDDLHVLADRVAEVLAADGADDRPYALFGHSLGAALGFEVALRLQEAGRPPLALFASGRRAPSTHRDEDVHRRGDAALLTELRGLNGTDPQALRDPDLLRMILPAVRADYRAIETYRPRSQTRLTCPIEALTGDDDPKASVPEVAAWREHTTGGFGLHTYSGGHFYLVEHARAVIDLIGDRLAPAPAAV